MDLPERETVVRKMLKRTRTAGFLSAGDDFIAFLARVVKVFGQMKLFQEGRIGVDEFAGRRIGYVDEAVEMVEFFQFERDIIPAQAGDAEGRQGPEAAFRQDFEEFIGSAAFR